MLDKIEKYLFYLLVFSIPFQTRKIFFYNGWGFSEWKAISVYFTDVIFFIVFLIWIWRIYRSKNWNFKLCSADYFLFGFILIAALSLRNSLDLRVSLFQLLKLFEFVIFYFYLKFYAFEKFGFKNLFVSLIIGGVFQAILAIIQFFKQADTGLHLLGETSLSVYMRGVAVFYNFWGDKILRAYGTTPHPNVLAAYLFLSIFALYFLWIYRKENNWKISWVFIGAYTVMLFGFLFTFSRTILAIWALGFAIRSGLILFKKDFREKYWSPEYKNKLLVILGVTLLVVGIFAAIYWPDALSRVKISGDDEAVTLRVFYAKESLGMHINLLGVGLGNFVNWLAVKDPNLQSYLYQPVHNIYLLIYNETGILGIVLFAAFLLVLAKNFVFKTKLKNLYHYSFFLVFLSVLLMGMFDHFLWTLQQGRFVFWSVLAFIAWQSEN